MRRIIASVKTTLNGYMVGLSRDGGLADPPWGSYDNAHLVRGDVEAPVRAMKAEDGKRDVGRTATWSSSSRSRTRAAATF